MVMLYIDPQKVTSPKHVITNLKILHNGGQNGVSIASMNWGEDEAIGIRWNVSLNEHSNPQKVNGNEICRGMPISYSHPVLFILPSLEKYPEEVKNIMRRHLGL